MSFDQRKYIGNYNRSHYKMFPFRVRKDDEEIIARLSSVPNLNKYIYSLIENDVRPSVLTLRQIKQRILPILSKHDIHEAYLFGSYARGEAKGASDVDIYCASGDIKTLIDQGYFEDELRNALGKEVDVVFIGATLGDYFKEQLEADKIRIC